MITQSTPTAEQTIDRMVWKRLRTDRRYLHAEDAEAQAAAEQEITDECVREYEAKHAAGGLV